MADDERVGTPSEEGSPEPPPGGVGEGPLDAGMRALLGVVGIGLLICGVVAAFVVEDGVTTAALLAAGFALLFLGYLGRYITRIRFREFEAELATLQRKVAETVSALKSLETVAGRYEAIRSDMRSGGRRDDAMEDQLASAVQAATDQKPTRSDLTKLFAAPGGGSRIAVLGAMKAHPDLRDPELILNAIGTFRHPFDHDRFMVLAAEILRKLDDDQQQRLRELIEEQRSAGTIKPHQVRWATSERLLRLMRR